MLTFILIVALCIVVPLYMGLYLKSRDYDGSIILTQQGEKTLFMLELDVDPDVLKTQKDIHFRVLVTEEPEGPQD